MKYIKGIINLKFFVIILVVSGCSVYKSIDVGKISDVNFRGMVDNKISLELKVPVKNPNNFNLKIKEIDLDVTINGKYLGKMKNDTLIVIPKNFDGVKVFPVEIEVANILSSAMSFYKLKRAKQLDIAIDGNIVARSFLHNKTIKVSEKQTVGL